METDVLTSSFMTLRDKLHRIALSYLESDEDARDALQDTWLKLRSGGTIETTSEARNKLVTVLRHVCIDRLRKAKPHRDPDGCLRCLPGEWLLHGGQRI